MVLAALSLAAALAAPPSGGARPREADPRPVTTEKQAAELCAASAPTERVRFKGDAVDRAAAAQKHDEERDAALDRRYRTTVAAKEVTFGDYDAAQGELSLSPRSGLSGAGGALRLWLTGDKTLPVNADAAAAKRVFAAQKAGRLELQLVFELDGDASDAPCVAVPGTHRFTVAASPVSWSYVAGGEVLARGGEGADKPLASAKAGAKPHVEVEDAISEGVAGDARDRVAARRQDLEGCYASALQKDPTLDGTLVLEVQLTKKDGAPEKVDVVADSVQDDALAGCVKKIVEKVAFKRATPRGGRAQIPVRFELAAPNGKS